MTADPKDGASQPDDAPDPWAEATAAADGDSTDAGEDLGQPEDGAPADPWAEEGAGDEAAPAGPEPGADGGADMSPAEWAAALHAHVEQTQGGEEASGDDTWGEQDPVGAEAPAADAPTQDGIDESAADGADAPEADGPDESAAGGDSEEDPWVEAGADAGEVESPAAEADGEGDDELPATEDDGELPAQPGELVEAAELVPFGEDEVLDERVRAVGALLFASPDPLSEARLRDLIEDANKADLRAAVGQLQARLTAAGLPFICRNVAGGWRLFSEPALAEVVARLAKARKTERISQAALETLAIVAYRQPVTKAEIEAIRGVQAGPMLRTLVDRHLVRIAGRADQPGSPLLYSTTSEFLDRFGLGALKDLPRDAELARD